MTVVPWFRADIETRRIVAELAERLCGLPALRLEADGEAGFGYRGRKRVTLLKYSPALASIEQNVRTLLHNYDAWIVDETTKEPRQFRPHVTIQQGAALHEGDIFVCKAVYIVEQKGDYKQVAGTINL